MKHSYAAIVAASFALILTFSACSSSMQSLPYMQQTTVLTGLNATGAGKIKHIVYIVQENRSFNNLFMDYPGAYTRSWGLDSKNRRIKLQPEGLAAYYVIDHSAAAMFSACNGTGALPGTDCRMNGFDREVAFGGPPKYPQYVYVPRGETRPYWDMAHEWVVADHMFQSHLDESFVSHQYVIAAQADSAVDLPYGAWGCGGGKYDLVATITHERNTNGPPEQPCWDYTTLGDELDKAGLTWRFYASKYGSASSGSGAYWSSYQAVRHIYYGPDWKKDVISPNWKFITDVRKGKLANFTWITPVCADSDHVNCPGGYGPSWVSALVNTVGQSKFWNSTAIFVQWDDWGGTYDPVKPPFEDYDGLGFRVPLLIISPYAKHGLVAHQQYETASVLRFAEDLWGLPHMAKADKRANSPAIECFDFNGKPRPFVKIDAPKPPSFFMGPLPDDYQAPDYE
jgi:phospholipase C